LLYFTTVNVFKLVNAFNSVNQFVGSMKTMP
jgi:hypothetical protein